MISANFTSGVENIATTEHLYQWDIGQKIKVTLNGTQIPKVNGEFNTSGVMVHFANKFSEQALVAPVAVWSDNGKTDAKEFVASATFPIPNTLLETATPIIAYITTNTSANIHNTIRVATISVVPRKKPNDYVSQQDYVFTLEELRAEIMQMIATLDDERDADYQEFKEQISNDIDSIIQRKIDEQIKVGVTEYEYLSENSVNYNGITYTITKDANTGLITKIVDSNKKYFKPTIAGDITDVALHNATFWAVAMHSGLKKSLDPYILKSIGNGIVYGADAKAMQRLEPTTGSYCRDTYIRTHEAIKDGNTIIALAIEKSFSINASQDNYTDTIIGYIDGVDLTGWSEIQITYALCTNGADSLWANAYFSVGEKAKVTPKTPYDWSGWTQVDSTNAMVGENGDMIPRINSVCNIPIKEYSGVQRLNFGLTHNDAVLYNTTGWFITEIKLI